jgi:hypothetical protein
MSGSRQGSQLGDHAKTGSPERNPPYGENELNRTVFRLGLRPCGSFSHVLVAACAIQLPRPLIHACHLQPGEHALDRSADVVEWSNAGKSAWRRRTDDVV